MKNAMAFSGLTLRDLEYAVEVARTGSFTAAAGHCAVSQPTLSAQVRKVEAQLGVTLFERAGRSVRVTAAGEPVLAQAQAVLGEARRLFEVARGQGDPLAGELRLGVIATLGPYLVPHLIGPLGEAFPDMRLVLREGLTDGLCRSVLAGEVDAVLLSLPIEDTRIAVKPLFFEPFVIAAPIAAGSRLRLAELDPADMIVMEEGHCLRSQALAVCKAQGPSTRHAASIETLRHLVAAGLGYSLLPRLAVRADPLLDGHLSYHDADGAGRVVGLAWRATDPRAAALRRLGEAVRATTIPGVTPL
jgi:LysR family hydrogen peroxide-inducible transcriptional activator